MITLKDIAKLAGVSTMTVSRVVNGQHNRVSEETIDRVQRIIKECGYVPNSFARSLASKSTRLIAIIVQGTEQALEYPYNASMTGFLCRYVQERGYTPILYYVNDYREVAQRLRAWNVDGAVFLGMFDENMRNIQDDNDMPMVFTDSYSKMRQVTNIGLDDYKGGELAARHLIEMGHRDIAFLGASTDISSIVRKRFFGLRDTLLQVGVTLPEEWQLFKSGFEAPVRAMMESDRRPTAFFVSADIDALRLMDLLRRMHLRIPEDVSLIGFDNLFFSAYTAPRLTTIGQDIRRKAQIAIDVLLRHIIDRDMPAENIILDVELIKRDSVLNRGGQA